MAADKPKSVLIGKHVCPFCAGKTHVKRIDAPGKRAYSHCLDEHDLGCSHTHYATNAGQERLLLGLMTPLPGATPTRQEPEPAAPSLPSVTPTPAIIPTAPAKRRGLFG